MDLGAYSLPRSAAYCSPRSPRKTAWTSKLSPPYSVTAAQTSRRQPACIRRPPPNSRRRRSWEAWSGQGCSKRNATSSVTASPCHLPLKGEGFGERIAAPVQAPARNDEIRKQMRKPPVANNDRRLVHILAPCLVWTSLLVSKSFRYFVPLGSNLGQTVKAPRKAKKRQKSL